VQFIHFSIRRIDRASLESLGDSNVLKKELGITSFGHRMQLVKHIQSLLKEQEIGSSGLSEGEGSSSGNRERGGSREGSGSFSSLSPTPGTYLSCLWRLMRVCSLNQ
jgi:hypothetical protein